MAKIKFTLTANPTFKHPVPMPVPGGKFVDVVFTFKHRDKAALDEFLEQAKGMENTELVMAIASGWELEEAFDEENVKVMVSSYFGAASAIFKAYMDETFKVARGN